MSGLLSIHVVACARQLTTTDDVLAGKADTAKELSMTTGIFNLLWVAVTVLMIVRPGSTAGVSPS
jgi:hypothetical protein